MDSATLSKTGHLGMTAFGLFFSVYIYVLHSVPTFLELGLFCIQVLSYKFNEIECALMDINALCNY